MTKMNKYIIVRTEGLYKIYIQTSDNESMYQYGGATFVMYSDAEEFINMKNGHQNAA